MAYILSLPGMSRLIPNLAHTTSFPEMPQSPFSAFKIHYFGSERGHFATPMQCGVYPVNSTFIPWDSQLPQQSSVQYFNIDSGQNGAPCPAKVRPFAPTFRAASTDRTGGAHSSFGLELHRSDGDQQLVNLKVSTPPGLLATLAGVPYCPEASIKAAEAESHSGLEEESIPSCPRASLIGESVAGAGAGTHPIYLTGKVYLAGPYKGAPLSLAVITPAVSGPYDFGNVVLRAALHINPETAQISAVTDSLPLIHEGIHFVYARSKLT